MPNNNTRWILARNNQDFKRYCKGAGLRPLDDARRVTSKEMLQKLGEGTTIYILPNFEMHPDGSSILDAAEDMRVFNFEILDRII